MIEEYVMSAEQEAVVESALRWAKARDRALSAIPVPAGAYDELANAEAALRSAIKRLV